MANAFTHSLSLLKVVQWFQLGGTEGEDFTISYETTGEQKCFIEKGFKEGELKPPPFFIFWGTHPPEVFSCHMFPLPLPPSPFRTPLAVMWTQEPGKQAVLHLSLCENVQGSGKHVACYSAPDYCFAHVDKGSGCGVKILIDNFLEAHIR